MPDYRVPIMDQFAWQQPVQDKDLTAPAGGDVKGDRYIVGGSATGDWATHDNAITYYDGAAWQFVTPLEGWICWVEDEDKFYKFDGAVWSEYLGQAGPTGPTGAAGATGPQGDSYPNNGTVNPTNLLSNGDFESWSAGTSVAPDGWNLTGTGGSVARESTIIKIGTYSCKITRAGSNVTLSENLFSFVGLYGRGRTYTFGCWVYATVASRAKLVIYSNGALTNISSNFHTGDSTWQWLTVTATLDNSYTNTVLVALSVITGDTTVYFDGAMLVEGESQFAFSPKPLNMSKEIVVEVDESKFSHKLPVVINGTTYYIMLTDS